MPGSPPKAPATDAFFAALVGSSSDAIISKDLNGIITSWNKGAERIFGYTAAEVIGRPITILFPPDRFDEEPGIVNKIKRGELVDHYETVRLRKDGTPIEISLTVSPILDENGKVIGASKVARDITPMRRDEERMGVTLASIGDAVIATDVQGRIEFINAVAEELTGWKRLDAVGTPLHAVFRIINEASRKPVESPVDKVLREGVTVGLANHTILVAKDGAERPIDDSAAPIRDRAGRVSGVVLVFRDCSERRAAELVALRLNAIIEGSDDAIIGKDLKGVVTSWNPAAERIFGYTAEEMIGHSITLLLPPDRPNEEQQILARLQRGERVDHFQTVRVRKDGKRIDVSLTISPIRDSEGHITGASKIARDVTALRIAQDKLASYASELEAKVRERTVRLEEMIAELEAFSYSLSHDLRAPLRAIKSFTEIVLNEYGEKIPEGTQYLRKVINAANRMDRLMQDVLSFTRVSRAEIKVAPLDVEKLVHDIIHDRPELHPPKAVVTVKGTLLPVMGHDASLTQCLTNLLGNAVKFVPPGVTPNVDVFTTPVGEKVRICIRDQGIGINPEGQRRLFAMFQRLNPTNRYEGMGVGLAIVRKAVERMHGTAGVESTEGKGSTFWIELPKAPT
jgi:PAS domain S-box-containing protein